MFLSRSTSFPDVLRSQSWLYDDSERSFAFLASKAEHDKCILTVRLLRVETIAALRYCVLTGASDGL